MWSLYSSFHVLLPIPTLKNHINLPFSSFILSKPITKFHSHTHPHTHTHRCSSSFKDDSISSSSSPNQNQLGYDPSQELFGLDVDIPPRDMKSDSSEIRSWFGPNGQYIRELPCPSCRGRGYAPCSKCGIDRSRQDCSLCSGKGIITCQQCLGERVIWEESIDENPWEKARSISPLKVKEDDEVDNLDLKPSARKKSKRVYRSPPPEVSLKISRTLKSLNAKTGLFSKRMKIIHRDPALHAQRVAAIKKAKGTPAARKHASETMKAYFSDPDNRQKRSVSLRGAKFFCKNCGQEGHRRHYCPELGQGIDKRFRCGLCNERGHNRRTCQKPKLIHRIPKEYHCRVCGQVGHNSRTCAQKTKTQSDRAVTTSVKDSRRKEQSRRDTQRHYTCGACGQRGHNSRSCSMKAKAQLPGGGIGTEDIMKDITRNVGRDYTCGVCGKSGHNSRTCTQKDPRGLVDFGTRTPRAYHCRSCGQIGHNLRTCTAGGTSKMKLSLLHKEK